MKRSVDWNDYITEVMADPNEAVEYLQAALEDGPEVFLVALRHVAKAQGGMTKLAEETELSRKALYNMLSEEGNPTFSSISAVVTALGLELKLAPKLQGDEIA
ncbi:MAG: putative addiction module antidote protein [Bdellovibrionales bacterium]|nr:putative addiction module antidote protein [Bdellovibrionales bacterium]